VFCPECWQREFGGSPHVDGDRPPFVGPGAADDRVVCREVDRLVTVLLANTEVLPAGLAQHLKDLHGARRSGSARELSGGEAAGQTDVASGS
jgi:hypothetical protein